jgi:hypothetical protein
MEKLSDGNWFVGRSANLEPIGHVEMLLTAFWQHPTLVLQVGSGRDTISMLTFAGNHKGIGGRVVSL